MSYRLYPEERPLVKDIINQIKKNRRECDPVEPDNPDEKKFYTATVGLTEEQMFVLDCLIHRMDLHQVQSPGPKIPVNHNRR